MIGGAVITLAAWLLPVYERQTRRVHRIERRLTESGPVPGNGATPRP